MHKKGRLGDMLVQQGVLTEHELEKAIEHQKQTGSKLGHTLVAQGYMDEASLLEWLAKQLNIECVDLKKFQIDPEVVRQIPETLARRYRAIPLADREGIITLAMSDPTDVIAFDAMTQRLGGQINVVVVREYDLLDVIDDVYSKQGEIASLVDTLSEEMGEVEVVREFEDSGEDAPILTLLHSIFDDAVRVNASDIHIEPEYDKIRIRYRVDGVLQEQIIKGSSILSALVLRLKLMAKLNISERRLPQDGRFSIQVKDRPLDVRIATMPVEGGEAVVMRLFDQATRLLGLDELGMPEKILQATRQVLAQNHGMILVTGPTGCGKSTTLYGALAEINTPDKKIITVEDPVEYVFERINQTQVHSKIGLNFSSVLRSALRHDPDVMMVGEVRDEETAQIALRAAMTGHLVLTTLHTNNAISSPGRLLEMGVPGFLVASALKLVIAQRLVRRLCQHCSSAYEPNEQEKISLDGIMRINTQGMHFLKGKGCEYCNHTGYKGRIGVYEVLEMNPVMLNALRHHDMDQFVAGARTMPLYRPMTEWALDYAVMGLTSLSEVLKLTQDIDDE